MDIPSGCDHRNICWPSFSDDRPVIEQYVADPDSFCRKVYGPGVFPETDRILACYTRNDHMCRVILPRNFKPFRSVTGRMVLMADLKKHERAHCRFGGFHD